METSPLIEQAVRADKARIHATVKDSWEKINAFAEQIGGGYLVPFDENDIGGDNKIHSNKYIEKGLDSEAIVMSLSLASREMFEKKVMVNVGAGKSKLGKAARGLGATFIDVDPFFGQTGVKPKGSIPLVATGENLPLPDKSADDVLLSHVLCVVAEPNDLLREAFRIVKEHGLIRIYPVVAFVDLRKVERPGVVVNRIGADDFSLVIEVDKIRGVESMIRLLSNKKIFCIKPDKHTWEKRLKGYYYDKEYDLGKDKWWLGDADLRNKLEPEKDVEKDDRPPWPYGFT